MLLYVSDVLTDEDVNHLRVWCLLAGVIPHIHKSLIGKKGQQKTA